MSVIRTAVAGLAVSVFGVGGAAALDMLRPGEHAAGPNAVDQAFLPFPRAAPVKADPACWLGGALVHMAAPFGDGRFGPAPGGPVPNCAGAWRPEDDRVEASFASVFRARDPRSVDAGGLMTSFGALSDVERAPADRVEVSAPMPVPTAAADLARLASPPPEPPARAEAAMAEAPAATDVAPAVAAPSRAESAVAGEVVAVHGPADQTATSHSAEPATPSRIEIPAVELAAHIESASETESAPPAVAALAGPAPSAGVAVETAMPVEDASAEARLTPLPAVTRVRLHRVESNPPPPPRAAPTVGVSRSITLPRPGPARSAATRSRPVRPAVALAAPQPAAAPRPQARSFSPKMSAAGPPQIVFRP